MPEPQGCALPLTRFMFGAVGGLFLQLPAALLVDFADGAYPWLFSAFLGAVLTGFLWMSPPDRAWGPPLAYLVLAGLVLGLLYGRGKAGPKDVAMFGALFGGWSLLAAGFAFDVLRRRRRAAADALWASRKRSPPTA